MESKSISRILMGAAAIAIGGVVMGAVGTLITHHADPGVANFYRLSNGLGFALVCSIAITNTLLQMLVTDQMRGRVMSMFLLSFMGTMPIGNILAGTASNHFGPQSTLAVGGFVVTLVATAVLIFNRRLRGLY